MICQCRKLPFWLEASAAILGALLALWLLQGDTNPEAMPRPEGSMGRTSEMPAIVGMDGEQFLASVTVIEEESVSLQGFRTFELRFTDGTAVTVMGSTLAPVIQYLGRQKKILMELQPKDLQRIER